MLVLAHVSSINSNLSGHNVSCQRSQDLPPHRDAAALWLLELFFERQREESQRLKKRRAGELGPQVIFELLQRSVRIALDRFDNLLPVPLPFANSATR